MPFLTEHQTCTKQVVFFFGRGGEEGGTGDGEGEKGGEGRCVCVVVCVRGKGFFFVSTVSDLRNCAAKR